VHIVTTVLGLKNIHDETVSRLSSGSACYCRLQFRSSYISVCYPETQGLIIFTLVFLWGIEFGPHVYGGYRFRVFEKRVL
jgi:hypothetical protein